MPKQIVMCLDGTNNRVKAADNTNVLRAYQLLDHADSAQISYYQPGVGTFSAPGAWTPASRQVSKVLGLAFGFGLRQNLGNAYAYLMETYEPGDDLYIFGFSRGAYTARALTGMLAVFGLFRPGSENLIPYAIHAMSGGDPNTSPRTGPAATADGTTPHPDSGGERGSTTNDHWRLVFQFADTFGRRGANDAIPIPVRFLGLWDTVKAAGNLRGQITWPFTRHLPHVKDVRHAIAIDEWRRPYASYGVSPLTDGPGAVEQTLEEVWFAGVHSDVGGMFPKGAHLSDIPFKWMAQHAVASGLRVHPDRFAEAQREVTKDDATGDPHHMSPFWLLSGWPHRRVVPPDAKVHSSVKLRLAAHPSYQRRVPSSVSYIDENWYDSGR
jgi:uncharacterized protein (DUF2235 family)